MIKIQVTYDCVNGKFNPISTIIKVPNTYSFYKNKEYWIERAKANIKAKRYWTEEDMEQNGYTSYRARIYPEKK